MIKLLTFTSLYPSAEVPRHGVFVETRLRHLIASGQIQSRVVAPVPWFPIRSARFGDYAKYARIPRQDMRHGITIDYPRYPVIPKIGMNLAPLLMAAAALPRLRAIIADGYDFDIIDAHYFYPDGVAAVWLGKQLGKPVVITARGSDVNVLPQYRLPRCMIQWAAHHAARVITVSTALKTVLTQLGISAEKIQALRNGVDLTHFNPPTDRMALRNKLGLRHKTLLSVGHLLVAKGHHLAIEALRGLPDTDLLIAGDGQEEQRLRQQAGALGLSERVHFLGTLSQHDLCDYYGASDALVLASSREGWANVLLEAMACGTPVLASSVGGTPELVTTTEAGRLLEDLSVTAIVRAAQALFADPPLREQTRLYAERYSWQETTEGQLSLFQDVLASLAVKHPTDISVVREPADE